MVVHFIAVLSHKKARILGILGILGILEANITLSKNYSYHHGKFLKFIFPIKTRIGIKFNHRQTRKF